MRSRKPLVCGAIWGGLPAEVCEQLAARAASHARALKAGTIEGDEPPVTADVYETTGRTLPDVAPEAPRVRLPALARLDAA